MNYNLQVVWGEQSMRRYLGIYSYSLTLFACACLMFLIEPMVGKTFLPILGGSPNVWNTCVLFFQVCLLLGYVYAHVLSRWIKNRWVQLAVHLFVVWLPALTLPLSLKLQSTSPTLHPIQYLLTGMLAFIGPVFFVISTTAPLLQKWYSSADFPKRDDPYFLYAASNFGSLTGLLLYPLLVEPVLGLPEQRHWLTVLYLVSAGLITICGALLCFGSKQNFSEGETGDADEPGPLSPVDCLRWLILTIIPASLFLGLTTYLTQELSSFPLLWMAPLAIYLLSFIFVFAGIPAIVIQVFRFATPLMVLLAIAMTISDSATRASEAGAIGIVEGLALHFGALFAACMACHGQVALERPATKHLTLYFLIIALGGVLGSTFNTILAPVLFRDWLEYPLMLCAAGIAQFFWPWSNTFFFWRKDYSPQVAKLMRFVAPIIVILTCLAGRNVRLMIFQDPEFNEGFADSLKIEIFWDFLIPFLVAAFLARRVWQVQSSLAIIAAFGVWSHTSSNPDVLYSSRNFFGCKKVVYEKKTNSYLLWNGRVIHGGQSRVPEKQNEPFSYYMPGSGIAMVMEGLFGDNRAEPFAVIGLGAGSLAVYGKPEQTVQFYEIDPEVIAIAENEKYFTFLSNARKQKADVRIEEGDGRLEITKAKDGFFRLIVIDAFSSDSIPTHLLTKEALDLYLSKLSQDGAIVFHISNFYFDLNPVIQKLAESKGLDAWWMRSTASNAYTSDWVVLTRDQSLAQLLATKRFRKLKSEPDTRIWTDDYSNPLGVLKNRRKSRMADHKAYDSNQEIDRSGSASAPHAQNFVHRRQSAAQNIVQTCL